ncbi:Vacuolar protein-sorting protein BRO1 [Labeo rohita]|uniref:Vacuolar protein-sorting protein BRO1 n=1 Tax=Labeo rohita TaxID=84645 RepID=A0ABQ8M9B8_LABRO|nr:Vacuolar protein-sorting protein BRO1 [Labeo rohita]
MDPFAAKFTSLTRKDLSLLEYVERPVEPRLVVTSDQVPDPATTPATREQAVHSNVVERSSAHCITAEAQRGLLFLSLAHRGLLYPIHWLHWAPSFLLLHIGLLSTILCLGTPLLRLCLVPPAPSGSSIPLAPPWSSVAPGPLWPPRSTPLCRLLVPSAPPRSSGSFSSSWLIGFPSPPRVPPPPAPPQPPVISPYSSMAPPSVGSTVGRHYGCGLGPAWRCLLQVPPVVSLAPPSVWFALVPPVSTLAPSSVVLLPGIHPPPEPPHKFPLMPPSVAVYGVRTCLLGGG